MSAAELTAESFADLSIDELGALIADLQSLLAVRVATFQQTRLVDDDDPEPTGGAA